MWGWTGTAVPEEDLLWLETGHCFSPLVNCIEAEPDAPVQISSARFMSAMLCILASTSFC